VELFLLGNPCFYGFFNRSGQITLFSTEPLDGLEPELLHRLKVKQPHIVMIIVTGFPTVENAMGAVNEGADGYILKPFEIRKLLEMVRKHLNKEAADHISNWMEFDQDSTRNSRFDQDNAKKKSVYQPQ
jgi:DNA-binding NtrC family response regulator